MDTELTKIDFDFYKYYKGLTEPCQKTAFKYLLIKKLPVKKGTFEKWVDNKELPSGSAQVRIIDIILDSNNEFPNYK